MAELLTHTGPRPPSGIRPPAVLAGRDLGKVYGNTSVLRKVNFTLHQGEVLAVAGENGAGKSTLMKIIAGIIPAGDHEGTVELEGSEVRFASARAGTEAGVVLVPQELHVVPHLSIAENMFQGNLPGRFGIYSEGQAIKEAREALSIFDLDLDPRAPARTLSPPQRRLIVLAAALHRSARVLILDEPTAALTDSEATVLLEYLQRLRTTGVGIIYITHRLDELDQIADRVLVLRNGATAAEFDPVPQRSDLVSAMLGKTLESIRALRSEATAEEVGARVLQVRDLYVYSSYSAGRPRVLDASFDIFEGEIVGLYGLVGAGRSELARALYGAWPHAVTGECVIGDTVGLPSRPHHAVRRGLVLLSEDRKSQGVLPGQSVARNLTASMLSELTGHRLLLDAKKERARVAELMDKLGVRPARPGLPIDALSGGNQQKVLLGRCLIDGLKVLILDEPTLGVDVGARREIYTLIRSIAREMKVGILLISSDVDEVLTEADRTLVMYKGRIRAEYPRGSSSHELLSTATGAVS
ncbi:sugar ABC transporter ATP-binding protein [Sinomonas sp. G460-2]|uniref:sugar ABC transporter ATP-binding protein n=1 Tax=Sinomonas sp. G460-2 TaxID=3393464 RepID=UPI0039F08649